MKNLLATITIAGLSLGGASFVYAEEAAAATSPGNIVEIASGAEDFSTLVAAVKAAGLVDVLSGEGPFTVFAPTNAAFAKLPEGTVEELLKPENKEKLQTILKFHVVPAKVMAADVVTMDADTAAGQKAGIVVSEGGVTFAGQNVVQTDIEASNGVIHVIDGVAMPEM